MILFSGIFGVFCVSGASQDSDEDYTQILTESQLSHNQLQCESCDIYAITASRTAKSC